jgi:hypothetical protein
LKKSKIPNEPHIAMLVSCAYMRNVTTLQHRTIHEFAWFVDNVVDGNPGFEKYRFDWNGQDAIETWIEKFHEYCTEEYKDDAQADGLKGSG